MNECYRLEQTEAGSREVSLAVVSGLVRSLAVFEGFFLQMGVPRWSFSWLTVGALPTVIAIDFPEIDLGAACCLEEDDGQCFSSLKLVLAASLFCVRK